MPETAGPGNNHNRPRRDDDADFVARCQKGDAEAFEVLVRRHQKQMLNIAYRMIGDYDAACDVVQEAFLSAYRAIGKFRGEARFSTWLCGIVLNHSRNLLAQRAARSRREETFLDEAAGSYNAPGADDLCDPETSVLERMEKGELETKVQQCIGLLDGDQRAILVLRDIRGFSYEEIGSMLKLPQGTVRSRLFRARTALKDHLRHIFGDLP